MSKNIIIHSYFIREIQDCQVVRPGAERAAPYYSAGIEAADRHNYICAGPLFVENNGFARKVSASDATDDDTALRADGFSRGNISPYAGWLA